MLTGDDGQPGGLTDTLVAKLPGEDPGTQDLEIDPARSVRTSLRAIASVVGPSTAITGVLYYFGWARTLYEAKQLGLDASLFGYSTADYMLLSLSSMFWPIVLCLLAILAALVIHAGVVMWMGGRGARPGRLTRPKQRKLRQITGVLAAVTVASSVFAVRTIFAVRPSRFISLAAPLSVAVALVCGGYALHLYQRFAWRPHGWVGKELEALRRFGASVGATLLLVTLFWTVSHYAAIKGRDLALTVVQTLPSLPDVTLYSAKRLYLQPPVRETVLPDANGAYRFSYGNLKFLFLADHKYFLRPTDPAAANLNIIIPESNDLRIELSLSPP